MTSTKATDAVAEKDVSQNTMEQPENLEPWNMFTSNLVTPKMEPDDPDVSETIVPEKDLTVIPTFSTVNQTTQFITPKIEPEDSGSDEESSCRMDCTTSESTMGKKRGNWSNRSLFKATEAVNNGCSLSKASRDYGIPRTTLRRNLQSGGASKKRLGRPTKLSASQEDELCVRIRRLGMPITPKVLRRSVYSYVEENSIPNSFSHASRMAGRKWLSGFLRRHPDITTRKPHLNTDKA